MMARMRAFNKLQKKIVPFADISSITGEWKAGGEKIVFTNGCFDLIHRGHIDYLAKASGLGNRLVIGLNSDDSVKKLKGSSRPYQDEISRAMVLASLFFTDAIVLFNEETPIELIKEVLPDVLVKGEDYLPEDIVGYDVVTSNGGEVKTLKFISGYSTSLIVEKIKKSNT